MSGVRNVKKALTRLTGKGTLNGYEDGTFPPDSKITRAEVSKIFSVLTIQEDTEIILSETSWIFPV